MWLYLPTSCRSAPEPEDSTSASDWRAKALAQSVTWNGKHSRSQTWLRRWKTASWTRLLFGAISEPSTGARGVERWIGWLAGSRASRTARPECTAALTTTETCGQTPLESSESSDPTASSWNRFRGDFDITSTESGQSYDLWVTTLRRDYSRRMRSATARNANASLPWRTPAAIDAEGGVIQVQDRHGKDITKMHAYTLRDQGAHWPTATVSRGAYTYGRGDAESPSLKLDGASRLWPAVLATDGEKTVGHYPRGNQNLNGATSTWPAATASDGTKESIHYGQGDLKLSGAARMFPAPSASDAKGWDGPNKKNAAKNWEVYSRLAQMISKPGHICSPKCRRLNPLFVEMLMGWPGGWTLLPSGLRDYESSVMEWSRWLRLMRSELSRLERAS